VPRIPIPLSFPGATGSLRRDLERFSGDVAQFAQDTDGLFDARPQVPVPVYAATSVQYGQLLRVDPLGGVVVVSPPPTVSSKGEVLSKDGGRRFEVAVVGAGSVIIRPSATTIDGATEIVLSEMGLTTVRFDGQRFHSSKAAREVSRTLEWRGPVSTMSSTFTRYLPASDTNNASTQTRNHYTIREPGMPGVARELVLHRYGASMGLFMPTNGPSGVCTGVGDFIYALEVNGSVRATGSIATGLSHKAFSLVASFAASDQLAILVRTFSGAQWTGIDSYHHALVRYT